MAPNGHSVVVRLRTATGANAPDGRAERSWSLASTVGFIARHPANRNRRLRALGRFAGWQFWKRVIRRPVTATFSPGLRVRVYPDSKSASLALYTGLPEYDDMLFTVRFLMAGDTAIDVGANIGLYSLLAAARVGKGKVIALEPHPVAADRLRENVALNKLQNVEVRAEAAGAKLGVARLTAKLDTINHIVDDSEVAGSIGVRVLTLDSLVRPGDQVALVKLDAEGFESECLLGAVRLLEERAVVAWIVEINGLGDRYGSGDQAILNTFERFGYQAHRYSADTNQLLEPDQPTDNVEWNMIFVRSTGEVEQRLSAGAQ